jgi:hypothetical protein
MLEKNEYSRISRTIYYYRVIWSGVERSSSPALLPSPTKCFLLIFCYPEDGIGQSNQEGTENCTRQDGVVKCICRQTLSTTPFPHGQAS